MNIDLLTFSLKWFQCFDKEYYCYFPILCYRTCNIRFRFDIAQGRLSRAESRVEWKTRKMPCNVSCVGEGKNKNASWVFKKEFPRRSHGDNDYATAVPWKLRDISKRTGVVESCILRRLLTGLTPISFAGGTLRSCPFNMQLAPSRVTNNTAEHISQEILGVLEKIFCIIPFAVVFCVKKFWQQTIRSFK